MSDPTSETGGRPARFSPRTRLLLSLGVVAAVVGVMRSLWVSTEPQVRLDPAYRIDAGSITINAAPDWAPDGFLLTSLVRAGIVEPSGAGRLSILDDAGVVEESLTAALASCPLIRSVKGVRRQPPRGVVAEVEYRTPLTLAVTSLGAEPLDADSVRLPRGKLTTGQLAALPRLRLQPLEGAGLPAPPMVGATWNDPRVRGACALIAKLSPFWRELRLEDLTADRAPERAGNVAYPTFTLRTRGGTTIVWGAAPGFAPPNEPTFESKLSRFRQYVAANGPLDTVAGTPRRVHVRYTLRVERRVAAKDDGDASPDETPIKQAAKPSETR